MCLHNVKQLPIIELYWGCMASGHTGVKVDMGVASGPFSGGDATDAERIAYIQEVLAELRAVSRVIPNNEVLTYFIEMSMMEAADKSRELLKRR